jgi:hypothetical protein
MQRSLDDVTVRGRSELRARADANAQISMLYDLAQANGIRTDMVDTAASRVMHQFDYNGMRIESGNCRFRDSDSMFKTFQLFMDGMPLNDAYSRSMRNAVNENEYESNDFDRKPRSQEVDFEIEERTDAMLTPPATLSIRGYGRFILRSFDGETKKGRLRLRADQLI